MKRTFFLTELLLSFNSLEAVEGMLSELLVDSSNAFLFFLSWTTCLVEVMVWTIGNSFKQVEYEVPGRTWAPKSAWDSGCWKPKKLSTVNSVILKFPIMLAFGWMNWFIISISVFISEKGMEGLKHCKSCSNSPMVFRLWRLPACIL